MKQGSDRTAYAFYATERLTHQRAVVLGGIERVGRMGGRHCSSHPVKLIVLSEVLVVAESRPPAFTGLPVPLALTVAAAAVHLV